MIFVTLALSLYQQSPIMRSIEHGMTQAKFGEPRLELKQPGFCKKVAWPEDCAAAGQSGAVRYLDWRYGIDTCLVAGPGRDSRVMFYDMGDA